MKQDQALMKRLQQAFADYRAGYAAIHRGAARTKDTEVLSL
jgi:hypothetical protein